MIQANDVYVVVQFCPWFKVYFPLFLGMVIYIFISENDTPLTGGHLFID